MGSALGTHNGAKYNQVINGHFYWYQEEWSNQGHKCLQRFTYSGAAPTARYTVTAGSGLNMTFNASGSSASGGVADFSWQFNDANGASTVEQTTPSITHAFPRSGAYSTGLAVFRSDGTATGTGGIVTTGHNGFTPAFTSAPAAPAAGQTVDFSGLTTVSRKPVSVWLWQFGDGTTGSGAKPTHVYAKPGNYKVTLVAFSGVGSAFPGVGAAPVYAKVIKVS
jgi:PKD repeat protein